MHHPPPQFCPPQQTTPWPRARHSVMSLTTDPLSPSGLWGRSSLATCPSPAAVYRPDGPHPNSLQRRWVCDTGTVTGPQGGLPLP